MCEKAFLFSLKALPADIRSLVGWRDKRVEVLHFTVALFASDGRLFYGLWIDGFYHADSL